MSDIIIRAALYVRVSTEEQAVSGYSLQAQEDALTAYAQDHHLRVVGIWRDEGHSARKPALSRPALLDMLEAVKAGKVDRILFVKLDRWFRNVKEYHKVQEILDAHGTTWQAILEDYDTSTADGRLKVNIMLGVAENESDRTSERIRFVFDSKRRKKEWCFTGGPTHWPYGYAPQVDSDGVKRCVKDPATQEIVQAFWDHVSKYQSVRKAGIYCCQTYGITRHYRSWMITARNELYTGTYKGVEGYTEPYVSRQVWEDLQTDNGKIKTTADPDRVYLFTGLIRCPDCGNTMKGTFYKYPNDRTVEYLGYRCNNSQLRLCPNKHQISERRVERWLLAHIEDDLRAYLIDAEVRQKAQRRKPRATAAQDIAERLRRLNVVYVAGNLSDEEYTQQAAQLNAQLQAAKKAQPEDHLPDLDFIRDLLQQDFPTMYNSLSKPDQRRLWRSLISRIDWDGHDITGVKLRF